MREVRKLGAGSFVSPSDWLSLLVASPEEKCLILSFEFLLYINHSKPKTQNLKLPPHLLISPPPHLPPASSPHPPRQRWR